MNKTTNIILLTGAIILFLLIIFIVRLSSNAKLLNIFVPEKFTSLNNVHIIGNEGKNRSWQISAKECWSGRDINRSVFEYVTSCTILEDNYPIAKELTARRIIVNSTTKDIEVFKNVDGKGWLSALIDFNRADKSREYSTVYADYIKFNPNTNKVAIKDHIVIVKKDLTIEAKDMEINLDDNTAQIKNESRYLKGDDILVGKYAYALLNKDIININSIEVYQTNKTAFAEKGTIDDKNRTLRLNINVEAVIEKTEKAMKETSVKKIKTDELKKALKEKTVIDCDEMLLNFDDNNFTAKGSVLVRQKAKKAKADYAQYDDTSENIIMTGNVYMEKEKQWIKTNKIIVSVKDETFHAIGDVEMELIINK